MLSPAVPGGTARFASIPSDQAERHEVPGDGGWLLSLYRLRAGARGGPVLLWGHAGGFAAGSYLKLLAALAPDADVFAFDARGHGASEALSPGARPPPGTHAAEPHYAPARFARDLACIAASVAALAPGRPIHYAAHSLNAAAYLRLGCGFPQIFASLPWGRAVLFEPPLFPPSDLPVHGEAAEKNRGLVIRTALRRRAWPDPEALARYLDGRGVFAALPRDWLEAHARATLRPDGAGYALACTPEIEAALYTAFGDASTWAMLDRFPDPARIHLVGGDPDTGKGRDWVTAVTPFAAAALRPGRHTTLAGRGHFMVFEDPARAGAIVRAMLG